MLVEFYAPWWCVVKRGGGIESSEMLLFCVVCVWSLRLGSIDPFDFGGSHTSQTHNSGHCKNLAPEYEIAGETYKEG